MLLVRDDLYVRHINRLMVGIDGTGVGDDALKLACELAKSIPGCVLHGVHVSHHDLTPTRSGNSPVDALLEKAKQRARQFGVELQAVHRTGDIGRGLCAAAEEANAAWSSLPPTAGLWSLADSSTSTASGWIGQ